MPLEILPYSAARALGVDYCASSDHPGVNIWVGPFWACLKPYEARELAHALIEAADAATDAATTLPVAHVSEVA